MPKLNHIPTCGIFYPEQFTDVDTTHVRILGCDPGKKDLITVVDDVAVYGSANSLPLPEAKEERNEECARLRKLRTANTVSVSNASRRHHCKFDVHANREKKRRKKKGGRVENAFEALRAFRKNSPVLDDVKQYFMCRRGHLDMLLEHYQHLQYRDERFQRFRRKQQHFEHIVHSIEALHKKNCREDGKETMAIAYGSWASTYRRSFKYQKPTLNVGLMRKLSQRFLVIVTPERMTSQTCHLCGGTCKSCDHADLRARRKKRLELKTKLDKGELTAEEHAHKLRFLDKLEVWSLRQCRGCHAHLHRDFNAAVNIGRRCRLLMGGTAVPASTDDSFESLL